MKKNCELCKSPASIYCDSDTASLCWTCDTKVHSANFLVARHSRTLLCQICQSPTPWHATGDKLSPSSSSICRKCVVEGVLDDGRHKEERVGGNYDEINNQVVSMRAPQASSSSSSDEFLNSDRAVLLKRKRYNVLDLNSELLKDEQDCSSSIGEETTSFNSKRSSSLASIGNIKRIRYQNMITENNAVAVTSKSSRVLELDLNSSP